MPFASLFFAIYYEAINVDFRQVYWALYSKGGVMLHEEGKQEEVENLTELSILCSPAKGCE